MSLSNELIMRFVRATKDPAGNKSETTLYGTLEESGSRKYVRLDGSDLLTPVESTSDARHGDRVTVMIKNHTATVTGNLSSPSARTAEVEGKLDIVEAVRKYATIENLDATNVNVSGKLNAKDAEVMYATIGQLNATNANVAGKLSAKEAEIKYATIERLEALEGEFDDINTGSLTAEEADLRYANIDFTNIGQAAMQYFYAQSGLIKNVVVGDQTITGELVGVTISGDRILGNTVVAEKLVIKGSDGLYYKLNTDGMKVEAQQTDENSLNGQVIKAKSITATKISVDDLVAFDATIGGFNITENSIYSGVKESVGNTTRGVYLDNEGQVAFGDSSNFIKYFKDSDGKYKLNISVSSLSISGNTDIGNALENLQNGIENIEIGGRNLLRGTQKLNGFYANATTPATTYVTGSDGYTYADFPSTTSASYRAISSSLAMLDPKDIRNRQVVLSYELRSDTPWTNSGTRLLVTFALCGSNTTERLKYRSVYVTGSVGTDWTKFEVKATLTDDFFTSGTGSFDDCTRFYVQIYNYSTNHLQIRKPKLEYGNKATDWSPAPEDLYAAVDDVEVGGRNLLRHTERMPIVATHASSAGIGLYTSSVGTLTDTGEGLKLTYNASGQGAMAVPLIYDGAIANNETVTLSFKYRGTVGRSCQHYILQRTSPNVSFSSFPAYEISESNWLEYKHTFKHADANARTCYSLLLAYNPGTNWANAWFEVKKGSLKLERGNKATDWVPAKEDVDTKITDASKTASNFIAYDASNGLQVGNKTSGAWQGFRSQITSAAFRILNASGTVLASYGEKIVELGRNATDAVIKLCGGKGQIEYSADEDTGHNFLQIFADRLRLRSSTMSSLYSMFTDNSTRWEKSAVNVSPTKVSMFASECIEPTLVEKVEGWTTSEFDMDGTDISATADNVGLTGRKKVIVSADNGNIELRPLGRVFSNRQILVSASEKTKHNDGIAGWYLGTDGTAHTTHASGGSIIAFHFAGSTSNTSTIAESAAGEIKINGMRFGVNKVLWSGASYMNGTQSITLNEAVSKQTSGIVLVFSYFENNAAKDHSFTTHFVPKKEVELFPGCGHTYLMAINAGFSAMGAKYLTFTDTTITGHSGNVSSGTNSGITFNNSNYVLRYVIGV